MSTKGISGAKALDQGLKAVLAFDERQRQAARLLILHSGVWMPLEVYERWPVLLPWVARDNEVFTKPHLKHLKNTAHPRTGLQRADNSPVGTLKGNLGVKWANKPAHFGKKRLDTGWWAAHLAGSATDPLTNSFVGSLVWLPDTIAKLTDKARPGGAASIYQQEAQAISWALYRHAPVPEPLRDVVERIWRKFPTPSNATLTDEEADLVNWFQVTSAFHEKVRKRHDMIWKAVNILADDPSVRSVTAQPPAYRKTLTEVAPGGVERLRRHLEPFGRAAMQYRAPEAPPSSSVTPASKSSKEVFCLALETPDGVGVHRQKTSLAMATVSALITYGVSPYDVRAAIGAANLRSVPRKISGDELWSAMEADGVTGQRSQWFVDDPIPVGGKTWVLKRNVWTEERINRLAHLCTMTKGVIKVLPCQD